MDNQENLQPSNDFRHWKKNTIFFLAGQGFSLFGSAVVQYAIIWYITLLTGSGKMITIATICGFLPQILISLFAGVWADRYSRKKLVILSDAMTACVTLLAAIIFATGGGSVTVLFGILIIRSFGAGIQTPSVSAIIPTIVPPEKLMRINGINGTVNAFVLLLAPAVSGILLEYSSLVPIFLIDVITASIAILIILTIAIPKVKADKAQEKIDYFKDMREGVSYIKSKPLLRDLLIFYGAFGVMIVPIAFLSPLLATRLFGQEEKILAFVEISFFIGALIGGVLVSTWPGFKNKMYTIAASCIATGVLCVTIAFCEILVPYLVVILLVGITMPFFNTPSIVLVQENVEDNIMGRVFSILQFIGTITMPMGMAILGPLSDYVNIQIMMLISGVGTIIIGVICLVDKNFKTPHTPKDI